jgi:hypothetical protein
MTNLISSNANTLSINLLRHVALGLLHVNLAVILLDILSDRFAKLGLALTNFLLGIFVDKLDKLVERDVAVVVLVRLEENPVNSSMQTLSASNLGKKTRNVFVVIRLAHRREDTDRACCDAADKSTHRYRVRFHERRDFSLDYILSMLLDSNPERFRRGLPLLLVQRAVLVLVKRLKDLAKFLFASRMLKLLRNCFGKLRSHARFLFGVF